MSWGNINHAQQAVAATYLVSFKLITSVSKNVLQYKWRQWMIWCGLICSSEKHSQKPVITCKLCVVTWQEMVIKVNLRTGPRVWEAGQHVSMFSVRVFTRDKLIPRRDTLALSAELRTLTVSIRRETAPKTEHSHIRRDSKCQSEIYF